MDIIQVLNIFRMIIVEFLVELSIFAGFFLYNLKKRNHFVLRLIIAFVLLFAIGFGTSFIYYYCGNEFWGRILIYFFLFFAYALLALIPFEEKIIPVIFSLGLAYAIQNIMYKSWLIFYGIGENHGWYQSWGENFDIFYHLVYYAYLALFIAAFIFVFLKVLKKRLRSRSFNNKLLLITLLCLATTVILCSLQDIYFAKLSTIRENHFDNLSLYVLRSSGNMLSLLSCFLVLYLGFKSISVNELSQEVEYLKETIRQSAKQYEISKDTIEMINVKCHDIKYRIDSLAKKGNATPEALKSLENSINIYDSKFETGNQVLNTLLREKSLYCEQNQISFSCLADATNFDFIELGDLYCLFGNLIDNALEAVKKIDEVEKRVISLSVRKKGGFIIIEEENYYNGKLEFSDGLPITTKEDKNFHGFGVKSLRLIARHYGGELSATAQNNIYKLSIIIPIETTK